jgi:hypothetical protein
MTQHERDQTTSSQDDQGRRLVDAWIAATDRLAFLAFKFSDLESWRPQAEVDALDHEVQEARLECDAALSALKAYRTVNRQ